MFYVFNFLASAPIMASAPMAMPPSPPSFATPLPFSSYRCFGLPWYWRGRSPGSPSKVLTWYQGAPGTPADIETAQPVSSLQGLGP